MGDFDIRTVKDYLLAIQILRQESRGDDYTSGVDRLAKLAESLIFKAKSHQLTGQGHREYRLNHCELLETSQPIKHLPVILVDPGNYDLGPKVHISLANHLDDEVAA